MSKILVLIALLFAIGGCQSLSRQPASLSAEAQQSALDAYEIQNQLNLLEDERVRAAKKLRRPPGPRHHNRKTSPRDRRRLRNIEGQIDVAEVNLQASLSSLSKDQSSTIPYAHRIEFTKPWRQQSEVLNIESLEDYKLIADQPKRKYFMALQDTSRYELYLHQMISANDSTLRGQMTCDKSFALGSSRNLTVYQANQPITFSWKNRNKRRRMRLRLDDANTSCQFLFKSIEEGASWSGLSLVPEAQQFGDLLRLTREFQVCSMPSSENLSGMEKFFLTSKYSSITCPETADLEIAGKSIDGLQERMRLLTGSYIPKALIDLRNPFVQLDYSNAPKLDLIVVSSLIFRSDFYGRLLSQALLWHAKRGTIVRILVSDILALEKDQQMYNEMLQASDNIKVQSYAYDRTNARIKSRLNELHRVSHTKIFATYSKTQPEANAVVLGGRNIHESYIFPSLSPGIALPSLIDYINGEDAYVYFKDVEVVMRSTSFTESVISHFLTYWQRQPDAYIRGISLNTQSQQPADKNYFDRANDKPLVRHLLSLPYKDDRELHDIYADLFDSAESKINITTPYFMPTKKMSRALKRAVQRGVDIKIITKTDLTGDNPDFTGIVEGANQLGINRHWDKMQIYDYKVEGAILHAKLVLIDDKLTVIGSINMNRRSFFHDVENAALIYSPKVNQDMSQYFDDFLASSELIEGKGNVGLFKRLLIGIINREL